MACRRFGNPIELCDELKNLQALFSPFTATLTIRTIRMDYPLNLVLEREGFKILMTHIGGYPEQLRAQRRVGRLRR
jgi:hypothetical protein